MVDTGGTLVGDTGGTLVGDTGGRHWWETLVVHCFLGDYFIVGRLKLLCPVS